jgi:hypothetical protein
MAHLLYNPRNFWKARRTLLCGTAAVLLSFGSAGAQTFSSGSTGADGAFNPTTDAVITVNQAEYNYTTINIPEGVTVTFVPDAVNNYPVVWLAQGDVTIAGTVDLSGGAGHPGNSSVPTRSIGGPGGWSGGVGAQAPISNPDVSLRATAGMGPGGAREGSQDSDAGSGAGYRVDGNAGYSAASNLVGESYGNSFGIPLLGGSGGAGATFSNQPGSGGGAGGGAFLIASSTEIDIAGSVISRGGNGGVSTGSYGGGGGSGGMIRLVANHIAVSGTLNAAGGIGGDPGSTVGRGGTGSDGRVRLDAFTFDLTGSSVPIASTGVPVLSDLPGDAPQLRVTTVAGNTVTDPKGSQAVPDVTISSSSAVNVAVAAANIPLGTVVTLRMYAANAPSTEVQTTGLTGTLENSTASASVEFAPGITQIVATASFTPTKSTVIDGQQVSRVDVSTTPNGQMEVVYITEEGASIPKRAWR